MASMGARSSSKFSQIGQPTAELAGLERLKKLPIAYNRKNGVATFSRLFLIGSISYLQVTMTYMRAWMSSKFDQIGPGTTELAALEHLKNPRLPLFLVSQLWLYLGNSQVSVYRTIGPLIIFSYKKHKLQKMTLPKIGQGKPRVII